MGLLSTWRKFKLLTIAANILFLVFGAALVTLGVYIIFDHGDLSEIVGTVIYTAGTYILIFIGGLIVIIAVIGCAGTDKSNRCLLITYIALVFILFLVCLVGFILVFAFLPAMNDNTKAAMRDSLKSNYGRNLLITRAWDLAQSKLRCCAVDNLGWADYLGSYWDLYVNADENDRTQKIPVTSIFYKLVPESCCWTLIFPQTGWPTAIYRDKDRCQHWQYGAPLHMSGAFNDAIYYRGCFDVTRDYMAYHGNMIGGVGVGLLIVMIIALVAAVGQLRKQPRPPKVEDEDYDDPLDNGY